MRTIPKGNNASAADLVRLAQTYGAHFRVNAKREVFLRHPRKLPPGLLQSLWENKAGIAEHVLTTSTSHVWSVQIDGRRVRVIDPQRQAKPEFVASMQQRFGKSRVGQCRCLWPEGNCDD